MGSGYLNEVSNLEGHIIIPAKNKMAGRVKVIGVGKSEIISSLMVTKYDDLTSKITIYSDYVVIKPGYPPVLGNQRRARLFIPYRSDVVSRISITPQNRMSGLIEIIEPPIYTIELSSVKDAFVRSGIPTLNYGTEQLMVVGYRKDLGEKFRSFIQFDANVIPVNASIKSAKLKLYNTSINTNEHQIGVYTAAAPWDETGITWVNQPAIKDIVAVQNIKETGYTEIDVTEKVIEWYEGREANYGFIIKAMSESYAQSESFLTRESSINKPIIEVKYTLNVIYSFGRSELPSTMFVYAVGQSSIQGRLNIREYGSERDLPARIHIHNFNYWLEANIIVSRRDVVSNIIVRQSEDGDLSSSLTIKQKGGALPHEVVNGKMVVSRYFVNSNLIVKKSDKSEIPSSIDIKARIADYNQIQASLFVLKYQYDQSDLPTNIIINKRNLVSNLVVKRADSKNLSSNLKLRIHNNFPSSIIVNKNILVGNLKINNYSQINGSILVKQKDELSGQIMIPLRDDIRGSMNVIYASHLPSSITIMSGYLRANIIIPAYGESVILGKTTVRVRGISEIYSTLFVGGDNIPGGYVYIL
jgi:TGF-beta propeptide.